MTIESTPCLVLAPPCKLACGFTASVLSEDIRSRLYSLMNMPEELTPRMLFIYAVSEERINEIVRRVTHETSYWRLLLNDVEPWIALKNSFAKCEVAIVILGKMESTEIDIELQTVEKFQIPLLLFIDKERLDQERVRAEFAHDTQVWPRLVYASYTELEESLRSVISFLRNMFPLEYLKARRQQDQILQRLEASMESNVLVLGKDSNQQGAAKIARIKKVIKTKGYFPTALKDIPDITYISPENKMIRVASLCRFIIVEDSKPSGHIDELRLCVNCEFITGVVRRAGTGSTWMQAHYPAQYTFLNCFCYRGRSKMKDALCIVIDKTLEKAVENAIAWANFRIEEQRKLFEPFYSESRT